MGRRSSNSTTRFRDSTISPRNLTAKEKAPRQLFHPLTAPFAFYNLLRGEHVDERELRGNREAQRLGRSVPRSSVGLPEGDPFLPREINLEQERRKLPKTAIESQNFQDTLVRQRGGAFGNETDILSIMEAIGATPSFRADGGLNSPTAPDSPIQQRTAALFEQERRERELAGITTEEEGLARGFQNVPLGELLGNFVDGNGSTTGTPRIHPKSKTTSPEQDALRSAELRSLALGLRPDLGTFPGITRRTDETRRGTLSGQEALEDRTQIRAGRELTQDLQQQRLDAGDLTTFGLVKEVAEDLDTSALAFRNTFMDVDNEFRFTGGLDDEGRNKPDFNSMLELQPLADAEFDRVAPGILSSRGQEDTPEARESAKARWMGTAFGGVPFPHEPEPLAGETARNQDVEGSNDSFFGNLLSSVSQDAEGNSLLKQVSETPAAKTGMEILGQFGPYQRSPYGGAATPQEFYRQIGPAVFENIQQLKDILGKQSVQSGLGLAPEDFTVLGQELAGFQRGDLDKLFQYLNIQDSPAGEKDLSVLRNKTIKPHLRP